MTTHRPPLAIHRPRDQREVAAAARKAHRRMHDVLEHSAEGRWTAVWVLLAVLAPLALLVVLGILAVS